MIDIILEQKKYKDVFCLTFSKIYVNKTIVLWYQFMDE